MAVGAQSAQESFEAIGTDLEHQQAAVEALKGLILDTQLSGQGKLDAMKVEVGLRGFSNLEGRNLTMFAMSSVGAACRLGQTP
jgi:hypothetical protein